MSRQFVFEIYYDLDNERHKMSFMYRAETDLDAFKWLCEEPEYQNLNYDQNIALNLRTLP